MTDTRISAADLLRLAAIASVSPEGTADEVVAILQRTGPVFATLDPNPVLQTDAPVEPEADGADSDKLAKPE